MADGFTPLDLYDTSRPIFLFGVPELAGFGEWIAPWSGALGEVLFLTLLVVVLENLILACELVGVVLCIVR